MLVPAYISGIHSLPVVTVTKIDDISQKTLQGFTDEEQEPEFIRDLTGGRSIKDKANFFKRQEETILFRLK